ncbi:DUF2520 domain-containing protein [Silvimonas sp.]|uniref:Rossmann-like and DUF2520 domain-containing protein n=1 Tax=Silvimonas sp. TaxID=2650811 RepID=UPI002848CAFF|nr:DUF2520 domain-containing protein [Silvimonas sp.]MDR3427923.1 DUF2520 domain-containing protein [Silvimonas sp.]
MSLPTLNVIGPGRLSQTLAWQWHRQGLLGVEGLLARDSAHALAAQAFIGAGQVVDWPGLQTASITLIATPDDAIPSVVEQLLQSDVIRPGHVVFHCSGALTSDLLVPLRDAGASVASVHPLKSFADPALAVNNFAGTWCGYEGDEAALACLLPLFDALGAQRFAIDPAHKLLYHAGAVLACNHLVALMETALRSMQGAGVPREAAWQALRPLIDGTLLNLDQCGPVGALTGPVARNDMKTVELEIAATGQLDPTVAAVYQSLTAVAVQLAALQGGHKR